MTVLHWRALIASAAVLTPPTREIYESQPRRPNLRFCFCARILHLCLPSVRLSYRVQSGRPCQRIQRYPGRYFYLAGRGCEYARGRLATVFGKQQTNTGEQMKSAMNKPTLPTPAPDPARWEFPAEQIVIAPLPERASIVSLRIGQPLSAGFIVTIFPTSC